MNLFVGSMLILVLADNLLLLYPRLGRGGALLLPADRLLVPGPGQRPRGAQGLRRDPGWRYGLHHRSVPDLHQSGHAEYPGGDGRAAQQWPVGSALAVWAALLLLGGAVGKSAQLPLQTWLPDAMAGPTPVSALIHAATMVTAGVYLIARTHVLFTLAPAVQLLVAVVGAVTLLIAGFSALTQCDIKRVLAYSTISQIGYMFLALGVGAWSGGVSSTS